MALVPFSPLPGINSDDTTFAAEGRWADCNNVRFVKGRAQTVSAGSIADGTFTNARGIAAYADGTSTSIYVLANTSAPVLQARRASTTYDISPASGTFAAKLGAVTFSRYGSLLIACGGDTSIIQWTGNTAAVATVVTNAPAQARCILVTPQRQLLAFNTNQVVGGALNKLCIRGSDLEDHTSWTPTSTNNSFEDVLDNAGYEIRAAKLIGSYVAVWTDKSLFLGQFVGDPSQTYRWDRVADIGLLTYLTDGASAGVVVAGGVAYWITPDLRFMAWTPGADPVEIPCPIGVDFAQHVSPGSAPILAWHNRTFNEVWFFYLDSRDAGGGSTIPTRYIAYSINENVWFRGQVGTRGVTQDANGAEQQFTLNGSGSIIVHTADTTTPIGAWSIQSADMYLDDSQRRVIVRRFIPDFEDQSGDVSLTLYTKDRPQSSQTTKGPYTITNTATKKDFRASGKCFAVKLSGTSSVYMRLGKPLFDVVPLGER